MLDRIVKYLKIFYIVLLSIPSRLFFGNIISFKLNLSSLLNHSNNFFFKKTNNQIYEKGYKNIKYNLNPSLIEKIVYEYNKLIDNPNFYSITPNLKKKFLLDPVEKIPNLKKLIENIKDELDNYYTQDFIIKQVRAFRNYSDESINWNREKYIYSNLWHNDHYIPSKLKVFILLNDNINKDTGCTSLINKKDSAKLIRTFKFIHTLLVTRKFDQYVEKKKLIKYCEGDAGDIFIVNTQQCLHAASIPIEGVHRDMVVFEIYPTKKNFGKLFDLEKDHTVNGYLRQN